MKRGWSAAAEDKLRALYATTELPRLAFLLKRTEKAIRSRAKVLGLRRSDRRPWTKAEDRELRRRYPREAASTIAKDLGRQVGGVYQRADQLGLRKADGWAAECTRRRWEEGRHEASRATQFKPGGETWNKGKKGTTGTHPNCRRTQFKKGCMSGRAQHNYVPIGTEKVRDGYLARKTTDDPAIYPAARWRGVHVLVWEEANGPVPPRHVVAFKEGRYTTDREAITLDALELVSRTELMRRNTLHRYPKEVVKLVQLRGALNRKINRRSKQA